MRKAVSLILMAFIMLIMTGTLVFEASANVIDGARYSVVRTLALSSDGRSYSTGTAFIVYNDHERTLLVTNAHCVGWTGSTRDGPLDTYIEPEGVYILMTDIHGEWVEAKVYTPYDGNVDLAILEVWGTALTDRPVLPLADKRTIKAADTVFALGFPGVADGITDDRNNEPSRPDDVTVTRGTVSRALVSRHNTESIQTDCFIRHGNSGGPLLNEGGAVVGVNTWGNMEVEAMNYAIHISYIVEAFNNFGLPYTPEDSAEPVIPADVPPQNPEYPDNPPPVPENPVSSDGNNDNNNDYKDEEKDFALTDYWWLLPIGSAAIAAGIVLYRKRQGGGLMSSSAPNTPMSPSVQAMQPQSTPIQSTVAVPPPISSALRLMCVRGHFAGTTFPIGTSVTLGRDPVHCQIIFPRDINGISGRHCEVTVQGASAVLTDKGSSFGTFVAGNRKLNPQESVQLNVGDSFYLADSQTEFKVI